MVLRRGPLRTESEGQREATTLPEPVPGAQACVESEGGTRAADTRELEEGSEADRHMWV